MLPNYFVGRIAMPLLLAVLLSTSALNAQTTHAQLSPEYKKWVNEDVLWIIKRQERVEFFKLATDDQRDQFVADFWAARNPTPGSQDNPFKREHYRRLSYANEHFATGIPGFLTDRGRVYIVYGPPDRIDPHPSPSDGYPYEVWQYRHIEGAGDDVLLKFVDECFCGAYERETELPKERD